MVDRLLKLMLIFGSAITLVIIFIEFYIHFILSDGNLNSRTSAALPFAYSDALLAAAPLSSR